MKNCRYFQCPGCHYHLKHEALSHYSTWIMVYEDHKIDLKFTRIINFTTQDFSESIVYQLVTIHYCVFLKAFLSQFPYYIIHKLLIIHLFYQLLAASDVNPNIYTYRAICTKNNLFILDNAVFDGNSLDIKFWRGMFMSTDIQKTYHMRKISKWTNQIAKTSIPYPPRCIKTHLPTTFMSLFIIFWDTPIPPYWWMSSYI